MKQFYRATRISVPTQRQREGAREKKKTAERSEKRVARNEMIELPPKPANWGSKSCGISPQPVRRAHVRGGRWMKQACTCICANVCVCVFAQRETEEIRNELRAIRIASNARPPVLFR